MLHVFIIFVIHFRLHCEIDKNKFNLNNEVDKYFLNSFKTANENKQILKDIQNKNIYYMDLIKSILKYDKIFKLVDIVMCVIFMLNI